MSTIILLGGASAFIGLVGDATLFAKIVTLGIVLVGVIQIVFQTDRCAADHRHWLRDWNEMAAEINRRPNASPEEIGEWVDRQSQIESDCVCEMRALANDCYNRTMNEMNLHGTPYRISRWQRLWMQLYSFENAEYR